jgi:hypothetical protein
MGQSNWMGACALLTLAVVAAQSRGQEPADGPFDEVEGLAPDANVAGPPRSQATLRIEWALHQPLREPLQFPQTPLNTIMRLLSEQYEIPIVFDTAALDAVAVSPEMEVDVNIANVTLKSALELMLRQIEGGLTYVVDHEVLMITTEDEANQRLEVRVYRVDDLVGEAGPDEARSFDDERFDQLLDIIISTVETDSWADNRTGEGEIRRFAPAMFVVSQTHRVHDQIGALLAEMRAVKSEIDAASPGEATAKRPVSRGIRITSGDFTRTPDARATVRKALVRATRWDPAAAGLSDEEAVLEVLPNRVIVRHVPAVVRDVERTLAAWGAAADNRRVAPRPETSRGLQRGRRGGF